VSAFAPPRLPVIPLLCNVIYAAFLVAMAVVEAVPEYPLGVRLANTQVHAIAYGGQAALLYWAALRFVQPLTGLVVAWIGATCFGVITEMLQVQVATRAAQGVDIVADAFGATSAVTVLLLARTCTMTAQAGPWRTDDRP
jgi:VanZ family protein